MSKKFKLSILTFLFIFIIFEGIFYFYFKVVSKDDKKLSLYIEKRNGVLSYNYNFDYNLVLPKPGIKIVHYTPEFTDKFVTRDIFSNGIGFFDDGVDEKKYKAVAIGDSFTRGVGSIDYLVNGWVELTEKNLNNTDIITLGIFGAGINTQKYAYDKLKNLIDHNVVIYNFFSGGDYGDNLNDVSYNHYFEKNLDKYSKSEIQKIINDLNIRHGYKHHLEYLMKNKIESYTIYFFLKIIDLANKKKILSTYKFDFEAPLSELRLNLVEDEIFSFYDEIRKNQKLVCKKNNCYQEHYIFDDKNKSSKIIKNSAEKINKFYKEVSNSGKKFILIIHPSARNFYSEDTHINYNELDKKLIELIDEKVEIVYLKDEFDKEFKKNYNNIFYKFDGHYNLDGYKLTSNIVSKKLKGFLN